MNNPVMTQNRKRCRNLHEDDGSDFMPLSKRINNLHINNALQVVSRISEPMNMSMKSHEWGPGPPISFEGAQMVYNSPDTPDSSLNNMGWVQEPPQYNPELNETQNPYYYNNKLLFDLFVERMQRTGQSFP